MKIAIVILNWNGLKLLKEFLPSVVNNSGDNPIYIIDNNSDDNSIDFINKNYINITLIRNDKNYGYAKGYNEGLRHVNEEVFCLLNNDVEVVTFNTKLTPENTLEIISNYDMVADCTDNFPTRYLINDACLLTNKPFAHAAVFQFYGQAMTIIPYKSACYRCLLPEMPAQDEALSCEQAGIIGTIVGLMGIIQANEILKYILDIGELLSGKLLLVDALQLDFEKIIIKKNLKCPICGRYRTITDLTNNQEFYCNK